MTAVFNTNQLDTIYEHLLGLITPEDLKWLKEIAPGYWKNFPENVWKQKTEYLKWKRHNLSNVYGKSFVIQTMIAAKIRDKVKRDKTEIISNMVYADGLPKKAMMELAEVLGMTGYEYAHQYDKTAGDNKFALASLIMKELGEEYL